MKGRVELYIGGGPPLATRVLPVIRNEYSPHWPSGVARFAHVPPDDRVRIRLDLVDEDLAFDDTIGPVELNARDLHAALQQANVFQVDVSKQFSSTVLFVGLSVMRE